MLFKSFGKTFAICVCAFLFIGIQFESYSQKVPERSVSERVYSISILVDEAFKNRQLDEFRFTAVLIRSKKSIDFKDYIIIIEGDTLSFTRDSHAPQLYYQSNLLQFTNSQSAFDIFISGKQQSDVELILINGSYPQRQEVYKSGESGASYTDCKAISTIIPQSSWRQGLQAPSYNRSYTTVENIIVHHSAGLNNVTDFRQAVRGIYILHTEVNGWSDIGYNYLIAPDGSIYAGRDPLSGSQDNVIGAHFCGVNSKTMGICLLGNYEEVEPTDTLMSSLSSLLSWKVNKEPQLEALGVNAHPLNSELNQIAGHRDGCNTACPGENVYNRLTSLRIEVDTLVANCSPNDPTDPDPVDPTPEEPIDDVVDLEFEDKLLGIQEYTVYPNPILRMEVFYCYISKHHLDDLKDIQLISQWGNKIQFGYRDIGNNRIRISLTKKVIPGIYFIHLIVGNKLIIKKILVF
ncbi:MAG: hypothetical protein ACJAT1_002518 [Marivirga sp.]|jgi:hypothetical protein